MIGKIWCFIASVSIIIIFSFGTPYQINISQQALHWEYTSLDRLFDSATGTLPSKLIEKIEFADIGNKWNRYRYYSSIVNNSNTEVPEVLNKYIDMDVLALRRNIIAVFIFCLIGYCLSKVYMKQRSFDVVNIKKLSILCFCISTLIMLIAFVPYDKTLNGKSIFVGYGSIDLYPFGIDYVDTKRLDINYQKLGMNELVLLLGGTTVYLISTLKK